MCCLCANLITSIAPCFRLASAPPHCPGSHTPKPPNQLPSSCGIHGRPNALQPSCLCLCFSSDGPVFLPSTTSSDCRFPLIAALIPSVYSNQHTQVAVYTSYRAHSLEALGCVARMTKQACHVANRPQASALILERRSRSRTAEIRLFACHVAHCNG